MLTREVLEARLEVLRREFSAAEQQRDEALRRVLTLDGAIQECEWALAQIEDESVK